MPLYALGSNGSGQLGVGHADDLSVPQLVPGSEAYSVRQLAAGGNHTVILCSDGSVRATGNNEDSRACICGRSTYTFMQMPLWEYNYGGTLEVKQVACTWSASLLLLGDGTVMVCGTGSSGEMGLGEGVVGSKVLRRIPNFPPEGRQATSISACMGHVVAILSDGTVYGWGKGRKGQLGEPAEDVWTPRMIGGIGFEAMRATCGKDFTIVLGKTTSDFAILGPNGKDRFGIRNEAAFQAIAPETVMASWCSVFATGIDGRLQAWGRDDHGQLPSKHVPEVTSSAAGSEHALALAKSGKVLAWGWGEHGNCGGPTDERGDVRGRVNEIELSGRANGVFAGCATSFIQVED